MAAGDDALVDDLQLAIVKTLPRSAKRGRCFLRAN